MDDPYAGNARGKLEVRIELSGSDRVNFPNGVEWAAIDAKRSFDLIFELVDVGNDGMPIVMPEGQQPELSADMKALQSKIEACGEDQMCLARTMMEFAQAGGSGANPFLQMTGQQPGRYRNFAADRWGTCVTGTISVEDTLSGVYIPPPEPARPYTFTRKGSLSLPKEDDALLDAACRVEVTLDQKTGKMSLRLPAAKLPVPVKLGAGAFTNEKAVSAIEGLQTIELSGQPSGSEGVWSGSANVSAGSASHNSGQVSAPLKGRVEWRFSEN
jgi:hypothetical protein